MNGNAATASDSQQSEQIPECIWNINVICFFSCQSALEIEKNVLGSIQVELNHQNMWQAVDYDRKIILPCFLVNTTAFQCCYC